MRKGLRVAAMVVATGAWFSAPARADQIALTSGLIDLRVSSAAAAGSVQLAGDRGFTLIGPMSGGFTQPVGDPLPPGATVTLLGTAVGLDLGGTATLDGVTYTGIGGLDSNAGGSISLSTTLTLPSVLDPPSSVMAPFTVDLLFFVSSQESHSLFGSGMATIFLDEDLGFGVPSWRVTGVRAELSTDAAPVPEPATLLLVGSTLGWAAMRKRRKVARA